MEGQPVGVAPPPQAQLRSSLVRRSARRTNVGLLILIFGAFGSGWVAFAAGAPTTQTLTTAVHGLFGVAVIALLPWKSTIIRRSARLRITSLVLLVILVGCLLAGFVQLFAGYVVVLGVTPVQVHVGAAVGCILLVIWHVLRHRRQVPRRGDLSRRVLLQDAVLAMGVGAGYALVGAAALRTRPDRPRALTGSRPLTSSPSVSSTVSSSASSSSASAVPATIWLFDRVPVVDPARHRLVVAGTSISMAELRSRSESVVARLDCTNGWYADIGWDAVKLSDLIRASVLDEARSLRVRSLTGYERLFPASDAGRLWLAVGSRGAPLSAGHGAPLRLLAPGRRGFWWVKWVAAVELSDQPDRRQPPFPLP